MSILMEHNENRTQTRNPFGVFVPTHFIPLINLLSFMTSLRAKCHEILTEIFTFNQQPNDKLPCARNYF